MIHTDTKQINTDLLYGELTYRVRKAIFNVYNALGFGHKENVYQKALAKEFIILGIPYKEEVPLTVSYKDGAVGSYRPDFIVADKVILEIKATEFVPKAFETQLQYYLKTTGFSLGLLVNFGASKVFIKRFIWTEQRKSAGNR